jgi:hypothetical protein
MQVHLEEEAVLDHGMHLGFEHDKSVLASRLSLVEGDVGVTQ